MEKVLIQGLATLESGKCDGRLNRTPNPVQSRKHGRGEGKGGGYTRNLQVHHVTVSGPGTLLNQCRLHITKKHTALVVV
jgi:hypothetical protein